MTASPADSTTAQRRSRRGFANMDPQRVREIARVGGRAAHAKGAAHEFTPQEARLAGQKSQSLRSLRRRDAAAQPASEG
ncbi:KGG domain-containing protein [Variovorax sp. ZT4R33]|uniref:KGG domain-containing protein n=1 Tax=Variovorax sp. ZT4R33 TaxID=3443743 RepID=UPI003F4888A3